VFGYVRGAEAAEPVGRGDPVLWQVAAGGLDSL